MIIAPNSFASFSTDTYLLSMGFDSSQYGNRKYKNDNFKIENKEFLKFWDITGNQKMLPELIATPKKFRMFMEVSWANQSATRTPSHNIRLLPQTNYNPIITHIYIRLLQLFFLALPLVLLSPLAHVSRGLNIKAVSCLLLSFISLFKNLSTSALGQDRGARGFWQQQQIYFELHRCILKIHRTVCHFRQNTRNSGNSNLYQMDKQVRSTRKNHFQLRTRVLQRSDCRVI
jgi:hypothetical protein